ncbi:hypothetical protein [Shinella sp.]|nr:hypothetical protein [Shinella sp.]
MAVRVGRASDSTMIARKLCDMRIVVVASSGYLKGLRDHAGCL